MTWSLLTSTPTNFNWTWVIELVVCILLVIWFLFYFNRLFATFVSYGIRAYTWHKFRVWIDIHSLQISFLAGRIFFKGVRYHGENETILIQNGYLTWRYWLRSTRQVDLTKYEEHRSGGKDGVQNGSSSSVSGNVDEEIGPVKKVDNTEARLAISVTGLEWFVYNRTPAYNAIIPESVVLDIDEDEVTWDPAKANEIASKIKTSIGLRGHDGKDQSSPSEEPSDAKSFKDDIPPLHAPSLADAVRGGTPSVTSDATRPTDVPAMHSLMLRLLPFFIECTKGAIILGNETTRALLVTTFDKAKGHIDASCAEEKDLYRQMFDFDIIRPVVQMKPNPDFRRSQHATAERIIQALNGAEMQRPWWHVNLALNRRRRKAVQRIRALIPGARTSVESFQAHSPNDKDSGSHPQFGYQEEAGSAWHGLDRYIDEGDRDDHEGWSHIDYARFSTILDSPAIHMNFYWDVPGRVSDDDAGRLLHIPGVDINGAAAPAYGMHLTVKGGDVNYGPWADRLRLEIQSAFFPNSYKTVTPAEHLKAGDWRQYTVMTINVDIEEEISLRVPTRERSKDWQWRGRAHAVREAAIQRKQREKRHFRFRRNTKPSLGPDVRPFGWMSIAVAADSTVKYEMDMFPREDGYHNELHLELKDTRASSSVNHALLWRCPLHEIRCNLSNPLGWNSPHVWHFNVQSNDLEMFLLRDHMFLLTDLIGDFTAGNKSEYMTFVPFKYQMALVFDRMKLYLNSNDFNIIDNPCDLEENSYLILGFQKLAGLVDIPMEYFSPRQSKVLFHADGTNASLHLTAPTWNTLHTFIEDNSMATLKALKLDGSYNYYSSITPGLTDSLFLSITGTVPKFNLHGFLIRHFMNVKENYFGDHLHFRTLEEYQAILADPDGHAAKQTRPPGKKENDLDVILTVRAEQSTVVLPSNIYSRKDSIRADVLLIEADMRFTNYYMDLQVNSSPLEVSTETTPEIGRHSEISSCQLFIESLGVYGHRLFGAPPTEPTYVCNWDFDIGYVTGECSSNFVRILIQAIQSFIFTMDDYENALPAMLVVPLHDVTFLRARAAGIRIWAVTDDTAFLLELASSEVGFNDLAGQLFAKHVHAIIPSVTIAAVDLISARRHHEASDHKVKTFACFQTSIKVVNLDKSANLSQTRAFQQSHIRYHDQRTHRTDWLVEPDNKFAPSHVPPQWSREPPAMPVPFMPEPIHTRSGPFQNGEDGSRRTSSFLSLPLVSTSKQKPANPRNLSEATLDQNSVQRKPRDQRGLSLGLSMLKSSSRRHELATSAHDPNYSKPSTIANFSSPWLEPSFSLRHVQPDIENLPKVKLSNPEAHQSLFISDDVDREISTDDPDNVAHMGAFCLLEGGLVGFCTPDMFNAVANLVQDLQPCSSLDRLDKMQQDITSKIMQKLKARKASQNLDLGIRLPFAHVRLSHAQKEEADSERDFKDEYDIRMVNGHADCRFFTKQGEHGQTQPISKGILVYTALQDLSVSVKDNAEFAAESAGAAATISNLGFWLSFQEQVKGKVQTSGIKMELAARRTEQMAKLLHRSGTMIEDIVKKFATVGNNFEVQHLIYHLTQAATTGTEPVFLTRPSYVLRTASTHARSSDSWKIISRLRQTYYNMTRKDAVDAFDTCSCTGSELGENKRAEMLSSFDQWKAWDNRPHQKVPIIEAMFGDNVQLDGQSSPLRPLQFELIVGYIAIVLDPGPGQSKLNIAGVDTSICFEMADVENLRDVPNNQLKVQNYVADLAVDLKWDIVELVSNVLQLFASKIAPIDRVEERSDISHHNPSIENLSLEVVVGADLASIAFTSVNLCLKLGGEGLRASIINDQGTAQRSISSFAIASRTAIARLDEPAAGLLMWKLSTPKIYGSTQIANSQGDSRTLLRLAAACDRLRFNLKQDIRKVVRVVSRVINTEVRDVYQRFDFLIHKSPTTSKSVTQSKGSTAIDLHLALFLNDYKLDFVLLPTLRYSIDGKVARTSITPRGRSRFGINFDLKQHEHSFSNVWRSSYQEPQVLRMPPINGRLLVGTAANPIDVKARVIVERIEFEAAAVRACFDVVNQPGFLETVKGIEADFQHVDRSIHNLIGTDQRLSTTKTNTSTSSVRFAVDGTLAGISIHCSAPTTHGIGSHTDLTFHLGATSLRLHNQGKQPHEIFEKPQFRVNVQEIGLDLSRRSGTKVVNFGRFGLSIKAAGVTESDEKGNQLQVYRASSDGINVDLFEETASLVIDIAAFLQERIKSITISEQAKNSRPLRRLTIAGLTDLSHPHAIDTESSADEVDDTESSSLFDSIYALDLDRIQLRWCLRSDIPLSQGRDLEDLVFSVRKIDLRTRREGSARLSIADLQLQIVPQADDVHQRSSNSALLPEMIFSAAYVSTKKDRRLAFQAKGKALDLRLSADFVLPASALQKSLAKASADLRNAQGRLDPSASAPNPASDSKKSSNNILGGKRLASLLVDADFAGAIVHISPRRENNGRKTAFGILKGEKRSRAGRYGQIVQGDNATEAALQAPGVAFKVEYHDNGRDDPALSTEVKVAASSNTLYPSVVPLILEISSSIKEILGEDNKTSEREESTSQVTTKYLSDAAMTSGDPTAILGKCKLNAGLWIQRQEFSLSCQPIARVSATARFDDIFVTVNTVQNSQQDRFFSILTTFHNLQASVQHVYSRESTASFEVESIVISLMNSRHVSATTGISAILNVSPMKTDIHAKQLQDFLLFREIWYPAELRETRKPPAPAPTTTDTQTFAIQKYQQIAATGTLPWNAVVSIQELKLQVDFGQGLGKSLFTVSKLWASSKKTSDAEQNLCIGFDKVGTDSTGRMSGFVELQNFRVRTSIRWPADAANTTRAPLVQGSIGLNNLRLKVAFDYQPFVVADISTFEFLIYNVRQAGLSQNDRLVGILNGGKVQAFCTTAAAAQGLAIVQAFEKLIQEKQEAYQISLQELDKYLRRKSVFPLGTLAAPSEREDAKIAKTTKGGFSLHTDVVVTLKAVNVGAFPNTFYDNQILKIEATDAEARFAVTTTNGKTHSALGMTLGQVRVALPSVSRPSTQALGEVSVPDVIERATAPRTGVILKVPRLVSSMETWQTDQSNLIEYKFRSTFEGKVDVGWNISRISIIRGMWQQHSRGLAQRLGKPLPQSAVKIRAESQDDGFSGKQEKITAVVNMPTSRFKYVALEPPIIDTPQLRDMGEATPPLEWIGLHRDKLPEATHSIAIVTLLEVAREVEDAYTRILGSS